MFFNSLYRLARHAGKSPGEARQWAGFVMGTLNGEETAATVSSSQIDAFNQAQFNNSTDVPFAQGFFANFVSASARPGAFPALSAVSGD